MAAHLAAHAFAKLMVEAQPHPVLTPGPAGAPHLLDAIDHVTPRVFARSAP
jgi:hypothetical protein